MAKQSYSGSTDKRIIQMKLLNGEMKEEDLQEYLESLPDVSANAEEISVVLERKDNPAS